jgi:hypothetical protein
MNPEIVFITFDSPEPNLSAVYVIKCIIATLIPDYLRPPRVMFVNF